MDQGSARKHFAVHNFAPTVTKFCVMWEGLSLPHDTKFGNCRSEIIDRRVIIGWSLIHGSSWSGLIKVGPGGLSCWKPCHHWRCNKSLLWQPFLPPVLVNIPCNYIPFMTTSWLGNAFCVTAPLGNPVNIRGFPPPKVTVIQNCVVPLMWSWTMNKLLNKTAKLLVIWPACNSCDVM